MASTTCPNMGERKRIYYTHRSRLIQTCSELYKYFRKPYRLALRLFKFQIDVSYWMGIEHYAGDSLFRPRMLSEATTFLKDYLPYHAIRELDIFASQICFIDTNSSDEITLNGHWQTSFGTSPS